MNISILPKIVATGAVMMLGGYVSATAAEVVDLGVLEPGVEYSWPQYVTVKGEYTPTQTGPVKFQFSNSPIPIYTSPDHSDESKVNGSFAYTDGGQVMSYTELKAGTTYYLYHDYVMNPSTLVIHEGTSEIKLISTHPSTDPESEDYYGGFLSPSAHYEVVVNFNFPVTVGNTFLVAPDNTRVSISAKANSPSVGCDVAPGLMELYSEGKIKEGDQVILRLLQVTDVDDKTNKYNRNGRCEITFTVPAKPIELVEVIGASQKALDNQFDSYYLPGDEKSQIKLIFDGPLSTEVNPVASIEYGDSDNLEVGVYHESVVGVNEGDTATFDFSGVRRRPIDMLPNSDSSTQPDALYISFANLKSPDGQRAYTGSKSNPTGYGLSFMVNVLQYTVVGDFTPARGSELIYGTPMEIWVMNGDKIIYDTIRFEYTENGEEKYYDMPDDAVTVTDDPYSENARLYTFDIPELNSDAQTPVYVRMTGVQCADGLDHLNDIYGEFSGAHNSVDLIGADTDSTFDVYDVAGVRVLRNADRNALNTLAKGIYIINGKKFVIR